jgi:adenylate cyclase
MEKEHLQGKLVVILHADVAGSTQLVQKDEQLAHVRIQDAFHRFSDSIEKYMGRVLELRGDALLAEFDRASDAITAALAFQADHTYHLSRLKDEMKPTIRVGIAMGEVIVADDTVTGAGVVLAQRVEQLADPGGLCITEALHEALPKRMPFDLENLGEQVLKGFDDPVRVYRVKLRPGETIPSPRESSQPEAPLKTQRMIVAVIAIVLIAGGGTAYWLKSRMPQVDTASVERMSFPLPDEPSIAVLPFDNLSGDPEQEYFSDGITNDIITDLSKFSGGFVIASNSTFTYKGKPVKVQQVAEDLGVRYVLEGSVQRLGSQIRINAQLIDAMSGRHLWAERYERDSEDLFAVQTEIIEMIVATLAFRVSEVERERVLHKETESLAAYDYLLLGQKAFFVFTKETRTEARNLFETAIELDPNYAHAYAWLSFVHQDPHLHEDNWPEDADRSLEIALEMARKAVTLSPDDYYSHWALGRAYRRTGDFDRALAEYERVLELNSNDADMLAEMVGLLLQIGRAEDGVAQIKLAMRINPHYPDWYPWNLGWALYFTGEYEEALASLKRMSNPPNNYRLTLAAVLVRLGRVEEARVVIAAFREQEPDFTVAMMEDFTFQNRTYLERWMEDLRTAGLPE